MESIRCSLFEKKKVYSGNELCPYQQHKIEDPTKVCVKCPRYKSLHVRKNPTTKAIKKTPVEKAINEYHKAIPDAPKDNVEFYLHIYKKINEARKDAKALAKPLQKMIRDQAKIFDIAVSSGWLEENEASSLWQS